MFPHDSISDTAVPTPKRNYTDRHIPKHDAAGVLRAVYPQEPKLI